MERAHRLIIIGQQRYFDVCVYFHCLEVALDCGAATRQGYWSRDNTYLLIHTQCWAIPVVAEASIPHLFGQSMAFLPQLDLTSNELRQSILCEVVVQPQLWKTCQFPLIFNFLCLYEYSCLITSQFRHSSDQYVVAIISHFIIYVVSTVRIPPWMCGLQLMVFWKCFNFRLVAWKMELLTV